MFSQRKERTPPTRQWDRSGSPATARRCASPVGGSPNASAAPGAAGWRRRCGCRRPIRQNKGSNGFPRIGQRAPFGSLNTQLLATWKYVGSPLSNKLPVKTLKCKLDDCTEIQTSGIQHSFPMSNSCPLDGLSGSPNLTDRLWSAIAAAWVTQNRESKAPGIL